MGDGERRSPACHRCAQALAGRQLADRSSVDSRKRGRGEMKDIIHTVAAIVILILWLFAAVAVKLEIEEWWKRRGNGG